MASIELPRFQPAPINCESCTLVRLRIAVAVELATELVTELATEDLTELATELAVDDFTELELTAVDDATELVGVELFTELATLLVAAPQTLPVTAGTSTVVPLVLPCTPKLTDCPG